MDGELLKKFFPHRNDSSLGSELHYFVCHTVVLGKGLNGRKTEFKKKKLREVIKRCYIFRINFRDYRDLHIGKPECQEP